FVRRSFEDLVRDAARAPITGWDFAWLQGRAFEARPSWHYFELVAERARRVASLLDLEVGSGSMIEALPIVPSRTIGTEGHAPTVERAARRLRSRGASLVWPDTAREQLPFRSDTFELLTSRHPVTTWWPEITRVLAPGGTYLSQQVGPHSLRDL